MILDGECVWGSQLGYVGMCIKNVFPAHFPRMQNEQFTYSCPPHKAVFHFPPYVGLIWLASTCGV